MCVCHDFMSRFYIVRTTIHRTYLVIQHIVRTTFYHRTTYHVPRTRYGIVRTTIHRTYLVIQHIVRTTFYHRTTYQVRYYIVPTRFCFLTCVYRTKVLLLILISDTRTLFEFILLFLSKRSVLWLTFFWQNFNWTLALCVSKNLLHKTDGA